MLESALWRGGCLLQGGVCSGGCLLQGVSAPGVSARGGCVCSWGECLLLGRSAPGVSAPGGVCFEGVSAPGGNVCSRGVCLGGCLLLGWCLLLLLGGVSQHVLRQTPPAPSPRGQTHACENITLAQLHCGR